MPKKLKLENFINPAIYFLLILSAVFFLGKRGWWPNFYAPVFFSWAFLISAVLIILPRIIFKGGDKCQRQTMVLLRAVLALALILNALGEIYLYQLYKYGIQYDKIIHFADCFLFIIVLTSFIISWYNLPLKKSLIISALIVLGSSLLWEAVEFTSDLFFKTAEFGIYGQYKVIDTIFDILSDIAGIVAGGLILLRPKLSGKIIDKYCHSPLIIKDGN